MGTRPASVKVVACALRPFPHLPALWASSRFTERDTGARFRGSKRGFSKGQRQLRQRGEKTPGLAGETMLSMWLSRPLRRKNFWCFNNSSVWEPGKKQNMICFWNAELFACGNSLCFLKWNIAESWMGKKCSCWVLREKVEGRCVSLDLNKKIPEAQENIHIFGTLFLGLVWC